MIEEEKIRLDKWLWAARFYKTRALASQAITGGKVHLNGQRIKPSRPVKINDCYQLQRGYERFEVIVRQLSGKRGPASIAQTLYVETEDSITKREIESEKRKLAAMQRPHSDHRPNKQERRKIRQFTGKSEI
ncbi:MAG: RNA-binding protein [Gammaproteobacteria bacterium]|nr:RNA-binding protein [Gammaproteobacteria bacterium]